MQEENTTSSQNETIIDGNKAIVDGVEYNFQPLKVKQALAITKKVAMLIAKPEVAGDDDIYNISKAICNGLLADDFEVNFDQYFNGKIMLLFKVMMAGLQINFPDLFETAKKLGGSALEDALNPLK